MVAFRRSRFLSYSGDFLNIFNAFFNGVNFYSFSFNAKFLVEIEFLESEKGKKCWVPAFAGQTFD